jgi:hypothetical protein
MRSKLLVAIVGSVVGTCLANAQSEIWVVRSAEGPFTLTCPDVTIPTTGTSMFNITMTDWDRFESVSTPGSFSSRGNLNAELSKLSPTNLPSGITLAYDSLVSVSAATIVVKYKFTTNNATPSSFTILWKLEDVGGYDLFDNQVAKDSDKSCLQLINF